MQRGMQSETGLQYIARMVVNHNGCVFTEGVISHVREGAQTRAKSPRQDHWTTGDAFSAVNTSLGLKVFLKVN